jgi:hypothetical protein
MLGFKEYLGENLGDAMNDLVDRLKTDGFKPNLVKDVADEWEINPALLQRMFTQKYNREPKDFSAGTDEKDKVIEAAKKAARAYRNTSFSGKFDKYVGKIFKGNHNREYAFVAWTGKDIHALKIPDQKKILLTFNNADSAYKFLEKNIL